MEKSSSQNFISQTLVRKFNDYGCKVGQANRTDGMLITPQQIIDRYEEEK